MKDLEAKVRKEMKEELISNVKRIIKQAVLYTNLIFMIYLTLMIALATPFHHIFDYLLGFESYQQLKQESTVIIIFAIILLISIILFHRFVYRRIFKDLYIQRRHGIEVKQGRVYLITNHSIIGKLAGWILDEKERIAYVNFKRFLNIFWPPRSLEQVYISDIAEIENRPPYQIVIKSKDADDMGLNLYFDTDKVRYEIRKPDRKSVPSNPDILSIRLQHKISESIIPVTRKASFVDASIRKQQLRSSSIYLPKAIFESETISVDDSFALTKILANSMNSFDEIYNHKIKKGLTSDQALTALQSFIYQIIEYVESLRKLGNTDFPDIREYLDEDYKMTETVLVPDLQNYLTNVRAVLQKHGFDIRGPKNGN